MDARWMPVLAAAIGVLGGVGGALAGGLVANASQEQGFEREQAAAIRELRTEEYGIFVATAEEVAFALVTSSPDAALREAFRGINKAKAHVLIVQADGAEVGDAAVAVIEALDSAREAKDEQGDEEEMNRLLDEAYDGELSHFIDVARDDAQGAQE